MNAKIEDMPIEVEGWTGSKNGAHIIEIKECRGIAGNMIARVYFMISDHEYRQNGIRGVVACLWVKDDDEGRQLAAVSEYFRTQKRVCVSGCNGILVTISDAKPDVIVEE